MLEVTGLRLTYPGFVLTADFKVGVGERAALLGPSGAGKSTILAAIGGFLKPASGTVSLDGKDITASPPGERSIAVVFQDQNLFPHMSAAKNIALALSPSLRLTPDDWRTVEDAMKRVGLAGQGDKLPRELSGGQQARVTLARVLLQKARLILLDEPFAALGPALSAEMYRLVKDVCTETDAALLMVTHEPAAARALCEKTIVVADGAAGPAQPTGVILNNPPPALAAYLGTDQ